MKKKLLAIMLTGACAIACAIGLAACGGKTDDTGDIGGDPSNEKPEQIWHYDENEHWLDNGEHQMHSFENGEDGKCLVCDYVRLHEHEHIYDMENYWYGDNTHWHPAYCHTGEKYMEEPHSWSQGTWGQCVCGAYKEQPHEHTLSDYYRANTTTHWQVCSNYSCPDSYKTEPEPHSWVDGVCSVCEVKQIEELSGTPGIQYELHENYGGGYAYSAYVTAVDASVTGDVTVSSVYEGYPVERIGNAFANKTYDSITLPDTIVDIGLNDFSGTTVESFNIPDNLESVTQHMIPTVTKHLHIGAGLKDIPLQSGYVSSYDSNGPVRQILDSSSLERITVSEENAQYSSYGNILFNKNQTEIVCVPRGIVHAELPDTVTSLPYCEVGYSVPLNSFINCRKLQTIALGSNISYMPSNTFRGCYSLTGTLDDDGGQYLATGDNLHFALLKAPTTATTFTVNNDTETILDGSFAECAEITQVTLPYAMSVFSPDAFSRESYYDYDTSTRKDAVHAENISEIGISGTDVMAANNNGKFIVEDNILYSVQTDVSTNNKSYTPLFIPFAREGGIMIKEGTRKLPYDIFENRTKITFVDLPASVNEFAFPDYHFELFYGCDALTELKVPVFTLDHERANCIFSDSLKSKLKKLTVYSYYQNESIPQIDLSQYNNLITLNIEGCAIDSYALSQGGNSMRKIETLNIVWGVVSQYAIKNIPSLKKISFDNCTINNEAVASGCSSLEKIELIHVCKGFTGTDPNKTIDIFEQNGIIYKGNQNAATDFFIMPQNVKGDIEIPNGIQTIGNKFANKEITKIIIPATVTSIAEKAFINTLIYSADIKTTCDFNINIFENCNNLAEIKLASGSPYTFDGGIMYYKGEIAKVLKPAIKGDVVLPNTVTSIFESAFSGCTELTSVTIPEGVTSIGEYAFTGCYKLVEVYNLSSLTITKGSLDNGYAGYYALNVYTSADEPSRLTTTDDGYIFYEDGDTVYLIGYIGTQTSLTLPDKYNNKNYAVYKYAFSSYSGLANITISNGVTSIIIGNGVTSIGTCAFYGCSGLTSITFNGTIEQWTAIAKDGGWDSNTGDYTVTCTDGKLDKKGNVITA